MCTFPSDKGLMLDLIVTLTLTDCSWSYINPLDYCLDFMHPQKCYDEWPV